MASQAGTSSGDRLGAWVLEALLASGGGGSVWRARHLERGEVVALKIPNTEAGRSASDARAFLDEARLAVRVSHRNVVKLLELGQHDGTLFLAMELLSGATLAALGRGRPPAPVELVVAVGAQLLDGLTAAHQAGVVHRDVKPSNVFVTTDGVVKLIDFGIATASDTERTRTRTGVFRGSLRYCAPEQVSGGAIGPRTDLFSTAVVLAELATGRVLFDQANDAAILGAVLFGPAPPLDGCPPALAAVLRTALEKDPERR
ncbi:MAG: serine/threonine protein kinase, partial [Myxococcaceae bacterium]|nr:serine/threonine protein kinase [Myxococcaceae bacterium]